MQILWLLTILLSEAGNLPSDIRPHRERTNRRIYYKQSTNHFQHYIYAVEVKKQCNGRGKGQI